MSNPSQKQVLHLDISFGTLIKITIYALAIYIIAKAFSLFLITYVALILASAFRPIVDYAKYLKIPRSVSVLLIYLAIIALFTGVFSLVIPPFIVQMSDFIRNIPNLAEELADKYSWLADIIRRYDIKNILISMSDSILNASTGISSGVISNAVSITSGVFGGLISVFLVLVLTFYMLVGEKQLIENISFLFPKRQRSYISDLIFSIQHKLGAWFRGQIFLCLIIGLLSFIGFSLIRVPYALPLALIAGLLEIIPYLGPWLSAIVALLVVLPTSPILALATVGVSAVVQELENHILVPLVMKQAVGLDPLFVLLSLGIGSKVLGIPGTILAVPAVATIQIIIQYYNKIEKERKEEEEDVEEIVDDITLSELWQKFKMRFRK